MQSRNVYFIYVRDEYIPIYLSARRLKYSSETTFYTWGVLYSQNLLDVLKHFFDISNLQELLHEKIVERWPYFETLENFFESKKVEPYVSYNFVYLITLLQEFLELLESIFEHYELIEHSWAFELHSKKGVLLVPRKYGREFEEDVLYFWYDITLLLIEYLEKLTNRMDELYEYLKSQERSVRRSEWQPLFEVEYYTSDPLDEYISKVSEFATPPEYEVSFLDDKTRIIFWGSAKPNNKIWIIKEEPEGYILIKTTPRSLRYLIDKYFRGEETNKEFETYLNYAIAAYLRWIDTYNYENINDEFRKTLEVYYSIID